MDTFAQLEVTIPTLGRLVRGAADQLDAPTPCASFRVRELLGHFVGNLGQVANGLRGKPMEIVPTRPEALGDDPVATYDAVTADLLAAAQEPGAMDRTLSVPFGDVPAPVLLQFIAFDLMMHSWDLAVATGQEYAPDDTLVAAADEFARAAIQPEWRDGDTFAAEVQPAPDATPLERLVAFSGRQRP